MTRRMRTGALHVLGLWAGLALVAATPGSAAAVMTISGAVFEDVNYGGGAGRTLVASAGVGRQGARVELFDAGGNFLSFTVSGPAGIYSFAGLADGTYTVRVVNSTVTSSRPGYVATLRSVQAFRTDASGGTALPVTDHVGGEAPSKLDAGNGSTTLAALTNASQTPQSITTVTGAGGIVSGVDFGFNFDTVVNRNDTGQGGLRQLLTNANALSNAGLAQSGRTAGIEHAIFMLADGTARPGMNTGYASMFTSGVATSSPASALPAIADALVMDGTTQPGFGGAPLLRLDGPGAVGIVDGLSFANGSDGSTLRRLIVTRYSHDGVVIQAGADNVTLAGNWIGTDGSGVTTMRNTNDGIEVFGAGATIGGLGAYDRNVIVNNGNEGINISGASATGNVVLGNFIGLEPDGTSGAGNGDVGIAILPGATGNTIGGSTAAARNVISMNFEGIEINTANNVVQGNYIGTDSTGTLNRGNRSDDGVEIQSGASGNLIGGTTAGAGNLIAYNALHGVNVANGTGNGVLGNRIHSNSGLGVDLGNNGVTPNDAGDGDSGANNLQNYPALTSAATTGSAVTIAGTLNSSANTAFRIQFFSSPAADPTGYGEGRNYLGDTTVTTNGSGDVSFTTTLSASVTVGEVVAATASDPSNNTSEFSATWIAVVSYSLAGRVFEDVNYGGGAGRDLAAAAGVVRPATRVELYGAAGGFVASTVTDAAGNYSFGGLAAAAYTVRAVNSTVTSSRSGYIPGVLPVQTYRTDASGGTAVAVTDYVGGQNPSVADAGNGGAGTTMNTVTGVFTAGTTGTAQSITRVAVGGSSVAGLDFGFNFDTIDNVNDAGQGSLRQFLLNSNALGNAGLAIQGQPAGQDVSLFMISDGLAHPGLRAGISNLLSGTGVAVIVPATVLPAITAANTSMDGTTQTANVGNTNPVLLGTGGTVGVDGLALTAVAGPEAEIRGSGTFPTGLLIQADDAIVRGLAIDGFGTASGEAGIRVDAFARALIENNVLGSGATSFTDPGSSRRNQAGVYSGGGSNGTVRNNLIGFSRVTGVYLIAGTTGWAIAGNEIRDSGMDTSDGDGITINSGATNTSTGNLITGSSSQGIVVTVAGASGNVFTNNTVNGNGIGIPSGLVQSMGITLRSGAASTVLDRNVIRTNYGAGIQVNDGSTGTRITRNSFALNGTITARNGAGATGQVAIDLNSPSDDSNLGTAPFYTLNDLGDTDAGGNGLLNFPVLVSANVSGGNLVITGYTRPGSLIELYVANADPTRFGEGETYLLTLTEGGTGAGGTDPYADTDAGTGSYGPGAINGVVQGTDNTNRFTFTLPAPGGVGAGTELTPTATLAGETSEFGGLVTVSALGAISGRVFEDVNYGGGAGRDLATAAGAVRGAARVELYGAAGGFVTSTNTDASGSYSFSGLAAGTYTVRAVNSTVTSSRTGYIPGLLPVQTYRTDASGGAPGAVTDYVGGQNPSVADAGNGGAGTTMNTTTGVFTAGIAGTAQSISRVTLGGSDVAGIDFGFNFDTIVNVGNAGQGSLLHFLLNANALANAALAQSGRRAGIDNAILMLADGTARPGMNAGYATQFTAGVATIAPASALPALSDPAVLDAQTQPGWTAAPIVEINGSGAGAVTSGLTVTAGASTIRGLIVNRFTSNGIAIAGAGGDTISGCWIGISASGATAAANAGHGIAIAGTAANVIGGPGAAVRNVISGNMQFGVSILGAGASGNVVRGNWIGLNAAGTAAIANQIGVAIEGGATGSAIGGTGAGDANVVTGSGSHGLLVADAGTRGHSILGNSIYANAGLGINLGRDAVTPNNGGKNAALPNDDMDFPVFTSAVLAAGSLTVAGYVGSAPGQATFAGARVEIFKSDADPSGYGEGRAIVGFLTTDASGNFGGTLAAPTLATGDWITATSTDAGGNTSEFGPQAGVDPLVIVKRAFQLDGTPFPTGTVLAKGTLFRFLLYVSNPGPAVPDVSLRDVLDPAFAYLPGSFRTVNTVAPCATGTCSAAEEAALYAAASVGTAGTDAIDGDTVSLSSSTIDAGDQNVANGRLDIAAGRIYAIVFTVRMK